MSKHTRQFRREKSNADDDDFPEDIVELSALLGSIAKMLIDGSQPGSASGRQGDIIFSLIYDPFKEVDEALFTSKIADIIKENNPNAISNTFPLFIPESDDK